MKKLLILAVLSVACINAAAEQRQQNRRNASMLNYPHTLTRTEIVLPEVNGYKVIKTDLHAHTFFSDAAMSPASRVTEAWADGLDAIAITDHIEYRPNDRLMAEYLRVDLPETKNGVVKVDLNLAVRAAEKQAGSLGITVIPGIEITRSPRTIGHFNALFTTDNNLIPDSDPLQAIRNARRQGALIQANHPGWRREDNGFTDIAKAAVAEGLIDGVEVFNEVEFYPDVIETAVANHFFIAGNTDIHPSTHDSYGRYGHFRNMTLVLAKDASQASIRDALEHRRTIAYAYGDLAGEESLLRDFFNASVEIRLIRTDAKGRRNFQITNRTSLPYLLRVPGSDFDVPLGPMSTICCRCKGDVLKISAMNMWYGPGKHPSFEIQTYE